MKKVRFEEYAKDIADQNTTSSLLDLKSSVKVKHSKAKSIIEEPQQLVLDPKTKALSILERNYIPKKVSFRDEEEKTIKRFIQAAIDGDMKCKCLLVTGMPGAGKTLICTKVLQGFKKAKVLKYNAASIKNMQDLLKRLASKMLGGPLPANLPVTVSQVRDLLAEKKAKGPWIVMIDEFDYLFMQDNSGFSLDLFALTTELTFVCTSNSMEFIQKLSEKYKADLPAITNVVFKPYSAQQLQKIMNEKIALIEQEAGIKLSFQQRCLKYISAKVFNEKGADMRKFFEQVLKIVKYVLQGGSKATFGPPTKLYEITMEDAITVIKDSMTQKNQKNELLSSLPLNQQLIMVAIHNLFKKEDACEASLDQLCKQMDWVGKSLGMKTMSKTELKQTIKYLGCYGYILSKERKNQLKIIPKVSLDAIAEAYENHPLLGRFFEKEGDEAM